MTDTKFTKGPWVSNHDHSVELPCVEVCVVADEYSIMAPNAGKEIFPEWDVHLIAAAPELYEALEGLYNTLDSSVELTPRVMMKARAALAKARGEA